MVGFGPGAEEHMTLRARRAIEEAQVVVGYSPYIKLLGGLLEGKEIIGKAMSQEIDRCLAAYEQARKGKLVALISSGDIGIYGMAGLAFEVLLQSGWTPDRDIQVETIPGSTALSTCAALVGAPLSHDFCSISLSDLLTPWPVIARRLEAAARGDFVVALYNPKSGRRTQHILQARNILLRYRKPETPVAIVKSAYRKQQDIQIVTLDKMAESEIGMLSTVLIGNSSTYLWQGLMLTPRGYDNKYADVIGGIKQGEKPGRSLSMGLDGWKGYVRQYIRDNAYHSLRDVARYFDAPMGEILSAIEEGAAAGDEVSNLRAVAVALGRETTLVETIKEWGRVRVIVSSEAGAVTELLIDGLQFTRRGDWLNIENENFHLHVDWSRVRQGWLVRRGDSLRSAYFTDLAGETVFNLSLVRKDGRFDADAEQRFIQCWQDPARVQ